MSRGVDREPCPYRVIDDAGNAFIFGLVGGSIWHTVGGIRNAPTRGQALQHAWNRTKVRAPVLGGSFAVWGTVFSMCDCTLTYLRKKEDPWNAIMAGTATGGILAARAGLRAAGTNALIGGAILAVIEGVSIGIQRVLVPSMEQQALQQGMPIDLLDPPTDPLRASFSKQQSLWQPTPPPPTNDGSGFSLDSLPQFDMHDEMVNRSAAANTPPPPEAKPFWKIW